ncbi:MULTISPECIES: hypothetical protein [Streptomyces]|uniref:Uncharacterized protein n=1 Tax=Streptomyces ehimensis TaxID=68195 RepID=A0ABV9BVP5_9ACTN
MDAPVCSHRRAAAAHSVLAAVAPLAAQLRRVVAYTSMASRWDHPGRTLALSGLDPGLARRRGVLLDRLGQLRETAQGSRYFLVTSGGG